MTDNQVYFRDLISLIPNNSVCFIQAPSLDNNEFLTLISPSSSDYYMTILLTENNKEVLSKLIFQYSIVEFFQAIEVKFNNKLLFEGYDGMEFGVISKELILTDRFNKEYVEKGLCTVSKEW